MVQLSEHFRRDDHNRYSKWLRQQRWFIKARRVHEQQEKIADRFENDILAFAVEAVMATQIQIEEFKVKLDAYDEATVIALMENQEMLDAIREKIQGMLAHAYVIEDGRRVFKSEDGSFVIDEFGENVGRDEISFDMIPDDNPSAETYMSAKQAESNLLVDRKKIHEFQEKVDAARERIVDGEISKPELDDLDAELAAAMPSSVAKQLSGVGLTKNAPDVKKVFDINSPPAVVDNRIGKSVAALNLDPAS